MFDIDGTLIESHAFDSECFVCAVKEIIGVEINSDWSTYSHVTDVGILNQVLSSNQISDKEYYIEAIKILFIQKIRNHVNNKPAKQISGANTFLENLRSRENVSISLATGGWYESAVLKLQSAGINISGVPIASANDHFDRAEIMKLAAKKAGIKPAGAITYFGDGVWDREACEKLGYNFVLVGDKVDYRPRIADFESTGELLRNLGL